MRVTVRVVVRVTEVVTAIAIGKIVAVIPFVMTVLLMWGVNRTIPLYTIQPPAHTQTHTRLAPLAALAGRTVQDRGIRSQTVYLPPLQMGVRRMGTRGRGRILDRIYLIIRPKIAEITVRMTVWIMMWE
jgi:hypothetical protein